MTREELEHAIRAACDAAGDTEVWVFGSQSILGQHPEAPEALRFSMEVDVDPKNRLEKVDVIDGALGDGSRFHETHGFYVHGVSIETAILPRGWERRTKPIRNANTLNRTGYCLEAHDLAAILGEGVSRSSGTTVIDIRSALSPVLAQGRLGQVGIHEGSAR